MTAHSDRDRLFVSYSRADNAWRDRVTKHFDTLHDILHVWSDELIRAGSNWREDIFKSLDDSQAAVLIVTANYLASRFVREHEIPRLLQRQSDEGLLVYR